MTQYIAGEAHFKEAIARVPKVIEIILSLPNKYCQTKTPTDRNVSV